VCAAGAALALLVGAICLALGAAILPGRGLSLGLDGKLVAELLAGMTVAGGLNAAIGIGIGSLIRKQTAAVVGILVYLFLLEPLITQVALKSLERFSMGNALAQLTSTAKVNGVDDAFGQITGGLLLAGYAVVLVLVGALVMQSRDVTD
jgi:ABC-2 type transport system permease protein